MSAALLIAISFSLGFFIESIIGFGGGLIAYSILAFFLDIKQMIVAGLYIGTLSSAHIFLTDTKSFDKKIFKSAAILAFIGTLVGASIFSIFSSKILSLFFGILMILLSIKIMFFDKFVFPKIFKNKLIFIGGISQGAFGIGGPFWVNALVKDFANKSQLRATMAAMFVFFNLFRIAQYAAQKQIDFDFIKQIWWVVIPIFVCIYLGHHIHSRISDSFFKRMIAIITVLSGVKFLTIFFG